MILLTYQIVINRYKALFDKIPNGIFYFIKNILFVIFRNWSLLNFIK